MNSNVLIFGAGINQLSLIEACNKLGYNSIVIDPNSDAPGRQNAKVFRVVQPNDYKKTKEIAEKYNVSGIATSQMENPLRLMAKLAKEKNYVFNSPEVIEQSLNKWLMKQCFVKNNIPCAKAVYFENKTKLNKSKLTKLFYPLIIKPVDAHSSRGVYRIDTFNEILKHIDETVSYSKNGDFLIEEFIDGKEISVEAVTYSGITTIVQFTEKIITPFPNVVEMGHIQPAILTKQDKEVVEMVVKKAINALQLDNTVSHTEIKIFENKAFVIEVGPRMGGDFISSYLTENSCGIDLDEATILMSIGIKPDLQKTRNQFVYVKYIELPPDSIITKINDYSFLYENKDIIFVKLFAKEGDIIQKIKHSGMRAGVIILKADSRNEVIEKANLYARILTNTIKTKRYVKRK